MVDYTASHKRCNCLVEHADGGQIFQILFCLLRCFPQFAIHVEEIHSMIRSIADSDASLLHPIAVVEVDFTASPAPGEVRSDSAEPRRLRTKALHRQQTQILGNSRF